MNYTVHVERPSEEVIPELVNRLERQGLHVMITFDLQLARANQADCQCPHHGTERCTCQYAVLLVYDPKPRSSAHRTITAHGRDGEVWLSLLKSPTLRTDARPTSEAMGVDLLELLSNLSGSFSSEVVGMDGPVVAET
jgi:hypothetical protein